MSTTWQLCTIVCLYHLIIFLSDKSEEEGEARLLTKEEEEVDVLQSWVEAGGFPAHPEEEAKGLLAEVSPFPCLLTYYWSFSPNLAFSLCIVYLSLLLGIEIIRTSQQEVGGSAEVRGGSAAFGNRGMGEI